MTITRRTLLSGGTAAATLVQLLATDIGYLIPLLTRVYFLTGRPSPAKLGAEVSRCVNSSGWLSIG
jgi:hypothetical protein